MEIEPLYVIVYNYNSDGVVLYVDKLFSKLCVGTLSEQQKIIFQRFCTFPVSLILQIEWRDKENVLGN